VASAQGCFACHGPGGVTGLADAGPASATSPPSHTTSSVLPRTNEGEIREWILDGQPPVACARRRGCPTSARPSSACRLAEAFLSDGEVRDLLAYVKAVSDFDLPPKGPILDGHEVAAKRGCFACHGPQGRGTRRIPAPSRANIPSWDGATFPSWPATRWRPASDPGRQPAAPPREPPGRVLPPAAGREDAGLPAGASRTTRWSGSSTTSAGCALLPAEVTRCAAAASSACRACRVMPRAAAVAVRAAPVDSSIRVT